MKRSSLRDALQSSAVRAFVHFRVAQEPERGDFAAASPEWDRRRKVSLLSADIKRVLERRSALAGAIHPDALRSAAEEALRILTTLCEPPKTEHVAVIVDPEGFLHVGTARLGPKDNYCRRTGFELATRRALAAQSKHRAGVYRSRLRLWSIPEKPEDLRAAVRDAVRPGWAAKAIAASFRPTP